MKSILNNLTLNSNIDDFTPLKKRSLGHTKVLVAGLVLTPLVDAFAILVIYLLVQSMSGSKMDELEKGLSLPIAKQTQQINDSFIIKINSDQYMLGNEKVDAKKVRDSIEKYSESTEHKIKTITILSDKRTAYDKINPILEWSSTVGIENIQLAVIKGGRG